MAQLKGGAVRVESGVATVKHVFEVYLVAVSGNFSPGDVVEWPVGDLATGTVVDWDPFRRLLRFYRATGSAVPAVGDLIENNTRSGAGTIDALGPFSPPNWDASIGSPTRAYLVAQGLSVPAEIDLATVGSESFDLEETWGGSSLAAARYGIHRDFTEIGFPELDPSDFGAGIMAGHGFAEATRRLRYQGARIYLGSDYAFTGPVAETQLRLDTIDEDIDSLWTKGTGDLLYFEVPTGVVRVDIFASVALTIDSSNAEMLRLDIEKNASEDYAGVPYRFVWGTGASVGSFGVPVTAGDEFKAFFEWAGASMSLAGDFRTSLSIRAVELET